jgi:hypothetical protein
MMSESRCLAVIANEIRKDWKKVNYGAVPYLKAMQCLDNVNGMYGYDSGESIVRYFLSNATTWRGSEARRIKKELKGMLK